MNDVRDTLDALIVALCRDFGRRESEIEARNMSYRTLVEYAYINHKIREAAREIAGDIYYRAFIDEIGDRRGYVFSHTDNICESTYKKYKKEIKNNIARKLHLSD